MGLLGSPEPARKSGSRPAPKMNSSEILSRRPCAFIGDERPSIARQAKESSRRMSLSLIARFRIGEILETWQLYRNWNRDILAVVVSPGNAQPASSLSSIREADMFVLIR